MWKSFKKLVKIRFVNHWRVRHYGSLDARINKIIRRHVLHFHLNFLQNSTELHHKSFYLVNKNIYQFIYFFTFLKNSKK